LKRAVSTQIRLHLHVLEEISTQPMAVTIHQIKRKYAEIYSPHIGDGEGEAQLSIRRAHAE